MYLKRRKIQDQTIVITSATDEIGKKLALIAAERGAQVVLAVRQDENVATLRDEIINKGGKVIFITTDISRPEDVIRLKDESLKAFGQINTWINNAGVHHYSSLMNGNILEERKLFDINFWGARLGSDMAITAMSDNGGVLINLGCEVSVAPQPLLGLYASAKHALKVFTDSLRCELKERMIPVDVCLVHPTDIQSKDPSAAAETILKCAEYPQREIYAGGPARLSAILDTFFPSVTDMMAESRMKELKKVT